MFYLFLRKLTYNFIVPFHPCINDILEIKTYTENFRLSVNRYSVTFHQPTNYAQMIFNFIRQSVFSEFGNPSHLVTDYRELSVIRYMSPNKAIFESVLV